MFDTCLQSRLRNRPKKGDLAEAVHQFLLHMGSDLKELWDWSDFLAFLQSDDARTRW